MQPCRVQLFVDEEQDEETGESLVVEQLATPELGVGCSRDHLVKLRLGGEEVDIGKNCHRCIVVGGAPTASANAAPQVAAAAGSRTRVDGIVRA